jgi:hypothetical protein
VVSTGDNATRTKQHLWNLVVLGFVVISSVLHLSDDDRSGWRWWLNIALLVAGVTGMAVSVVQLSRRKA